MARGKSEPPTIDPDPISFQVQRLVMSQPGLLEVSGRWFGVRGRRFVRPTLTLVAGGTPVRILADLAQKPWATEDGDEWLATFAFDGELEDASELELSVAPDIVVKLADGPVAADSAPADPFPAQARRAPRVRTDPGRARPSLSEHAQEIERLTARIAALDEALDREHARRAAAEHELEDERTEALNLRSQAGRLRSELDLARARQSEMEATSAELDAARRALGRERAEAEQLRARLAQAEFARIDAESALAQAESARTEAEAALVRAESALAQARPGGESAAAAATTVRRRRSDPPAAVARQSAEAAQQESAAATRSRARTESAEQARLRPLPESAAEPSGSRTEPLVAQPGRGAEPAPVARSQPPVGRERPLNPSLRHRTNWLGRVLAVLIILAVIAAVILVIRTTVSP